MCVYIYIYIYQKKTILFADAYNDPVDATKNHACTQPPLGLLFGTAKYREFKASKVGGRLCTETRDGHGQGQEVFDAAALRGHLHGICARGGDMFAYAYTAYIKTTFSRHLLKR